jgi:hypothetical protein
MSREIDPIALQDELQQRIHRYLLTALPISRRFPSLRAQAEKLINKPETVIKGPFLEAIPDFPKGLSLKELVEKGVLHEGFAQLGSPVFERPLHEHQEKSIRQVVTEKKNIVVATGTGSGKTECFLFPLIDCLLKANLSGKPGIRAIIVYPLNALANDQLYQRLAPILADKLADYGLSVGRYTGQTRADMSRKKIDEQLLASDFIKQLFPKGIPPNWLLSRQEMLETPPNVLVTNYAMLEHLLLLPHNRPLFHGVDLKFLVLDELHSYAGTQATEVAMLLRKLVNRYAKDKDVRCVGTSASLSSVAGEEKKVAAFASRLFHAPFEGPIKAARQRHRLLSTAPHASEFSMPQWRKLKDLLSRVREIKAPAEAITAWNEAVISEEIDLLVDNTQESLPQALSKALGADPGIQRLAEILATEGSILVSEVADRIFGATGSNHDRQDAVRAMVTIGAYARETPEGYPLLPARYHIFTKGMEDATIQLAPAAVSREHAINLRLNSEFHDVDTHAPRFRLLTCRKCGELYFEGWESTGRQMIQPERGKGLKRSVFWLRPKDSVVLADDEPDSEADTPGAPHHEHECFIHPETGACCDFLPEGEDESEWIKTWRAQMAKEDDDDKLSGTARVTHCHSCGSVERTEIITPFHPGDQALSATICDGLYEAIPKKQGCERYPGEGRALLVFSDNRQDAAFFAPSLQRSHEEILLRWRVIRELRKHEGRAKLMDVATALGDDGLLRKGFTDENGRPLKPEDAEKHFKALLLGEFCTPGGARSSLEDLGIVEVNYTMDLAELADRAGIRHVHGADIVRFVLDVMRSNRAIKMPSGISAENDFYWGHYAQSDRVYRLQSDEHRFNLLPQIRPSGQPFSNRFVHVLRDRLGIVEWSAMLSNLWRVLIEDTDSSGMEHPTDGDATSLVLRPGTLRLVLGPDEAPVYRCNKCGTRSRWSLANQCLRWKCSGTMEQIPLPEWTEEIRRNHYQQLYRSKKPIPTLLAREHTAALGADLKERIESGFKKGELNLLSCSTTMEMGIDLGDLSAVMLRNVPPGVANYQQRAGRAGRRGQGAPVSLTYARNRRYDQTTFYEAQTFLRKPPRTPFVHLANDRLLMRHQFSLLLSDYLQHNSLDQHGLQIGQLFGLARIGMQDGRLSTEHPSPFGQNEVAGFSSKLAAWSDSEFSANALKAASDLHTKVISDLNEEEASRLVFDGQRLKSAFVELLSGIADNFSNRYSFYWGRRDQAMTDGQPEAAARNQNQCLRLANQQMINYLSKHGAIPTYSFPVDSIELEVIDGSSGNQGGNDIELSRDARLGIVEYAPDSEVVANGRVWISRGIDSNPRAFMPTMHYKVCGQCRHIEQQPDRSLIPVSCPACGAAFDGLPRRYIEPLSFVTSLKEKDGFEPGARRIKPPPALEQMLIGNAPETAFQSTDLTHVSMAYQDSRAGRMVVINQGRSNGFLKCNRCSATQIKRKPSQVLGAHENPRTGKPCNSSESQEPSGAQFTNIDLAHTFFTDVLQIRTGLSIDLPGQLPNGVSPFDFRDEIARTVVEAMRLGCVELLSVPDGEVTASFRWTGPGHLEIILSDSVSGGAGYVGQVKRIGAKRLFSEAKRVLDCPKDCTTGCSSCLRSYSNQFYWDKFRRVEAASYISKVLSYKQDDPFLATGAKQILSADFTSLLQQAVEVVWFSQRMGDFGGAIPYTEDAAASMEPPIHTLIPGARHLREWLGTGKTIQIVAAQIPDFAAFELPKARRFAEAFSEDLRTDRLKISKIPRELLAGSMIPMAALRLPGTLHWTGIHCMHGSPGLVDCAQFPEPLMSAETPPGKIDEWLHSSKPVSISPEKEDSRLKRFLLEPQRKSTSALQPIMDELLRDGPKVISIQDRYVVAKASNKNSLREFLSLLADRYTASGSSAPGELRLVVGPVSPHGGSREREEWRANLKEIKQWFCSHKFWSKVRFDEKLRELSRGCERDYHDRLITGETPAAGKAKGKKVMIEMTGGIDILMDERETTRLFVCRVNNES